ncbi:MAG: hypothetical protein JO165_14095 [Candidatus Eremiobacteraeota bacterium]|nr:hypothetical protein [Candidatus Eremiobacteraeota bacterium]
MAHRVLDLLEAHPEYYERMNATAAQLADGIRRVFSRRGLPFSVRQLESIVDFKFRPGITRNYDDACAADKATFAQYYHAMRERGILLPPSQNEVMFISTAHSRDDIDETIQAIDDSLIAIGF